MTSFALFAAESKSMLNLNTVDIIIIVTYFVAVLGIGFYLKKFVSTGDEFFMAGRKMTAWIAGLSFISANLSSLETMGWSAMAYQYGILGAHAYFIGAIPGILFLAIVMMPFYYICKTHSVPGYLQLRYGENSRILAGVTFAVMTVMVSGTSVFAMAKILQLLLGWNMNVSIWIASLTVAIYVTLGGLVSAVFNEVLQFFLIWFGSLLIPILGLIDAGGWTNMMAKIKENVKVIHPTLPSSVDFSSMWGCLKDFDNPMGIDWIGMFFGLGLAVSFGYWCTDFLQVQRVIVAKNLRAAQNGTIIGAVLKMCVPLIVTIPGLLGLALLTGADGSTMVLVPESDPRANITHKTFNDVLPLLMGQYLGPGLLGLGVTGMIAGFMSGMAGNVSAFATVWTYDVYRPLLVKNASDHHYLNVGRWCSIIGVLLSIATAYLCLLFSNILEFLQVLIFFFIVPLFGVVTLGMLWKRATPTGGFLGFLAGILVSISMWVYVHTFPYGYQPDPIVTLQTVTEKDRTETKVVARVQRAETPRPAGDAGPADAPGEKKPALNGKILEVIIESGTITTSNVPIAPGPGQEPVDLGEFTIAGGDVVLPGTAELLNQGKPKKTGVKLLAKEVRLAGTDEEDKFGIEIEDVKVVLKPGVKVLASRSLKYFVPAVFNPEHHKYIARSEKAKPMAVNMYSALWTLCVCVGTLVLVSLVTKPKSDEELKNLVMGLTPLPDEGPCPWYEQPKLWAAIVLIVLVAINIIFW